MRNGPAATATTTQTTETTTPPTRPDDTTFGEDAPLASTVEMLGATVGATIVVDSAVGDEVGAMLST